MLRTTVKILTLPALLSVLLAGGGCRSASDGAERLTLESALVLAEANLLDVRTDGRMKRLLQEYNEGATLSMLGDLEALDDSASPSRRCGLFFNALENAVLYNLVLNAPSAEEARELVRHRESELIACEVELLCRRLAELRSAPASDGTEERIYEAEFELRMRLGGGALPQLAGIRPLPEPYGDADEFLLRAALRRAGAPPLASDPGLRAAALAALDGFRDASGELKIGTVVRRLFYIQSQRHRYMDIYAPCREEVNALAFLIGVAAEWELARGEFARALSGVAAPGEAEAVGCYWLYASGTLPERRPGGPPLEKERVDRAAAALKTLFAD